MRISVIIPAFNEENSIGSLIRWVQDNSAGHVYEIIVADGGSTDNTKEMAGNLGAVVLECSKKGRAFQMNQGAGRATGDLLYFLHADTYPPDGFDNLILSSVEKGAEAGCFRLKFDDPHPLLRFYGWMTRFDMNLIRFGDQSLFVRRDTFIASGGFREELIVMEDQDMVIRLKRNIRFDIIHEHVTTSARKYRVNGVVRLQLIFTLILILYYAGTEQDRLVKIYGSLVRS